MAKGYYLYRHRISVKSDAGFAAGQLDNVSVGEDGLVTATFSNGDTQALGKLAIANFSNPPTTN